MSLRDNKRGRVDGAVLEAERVYRGAEHVFGPGNQPECGMNGCVPGEAQKENRNNDARHGSPNRSPTDFRMTLKPAWIANGWCCGIWFG